MYSSKFLHLSQYGVIRLRVTTLRDGLAKISKIRKKVKFYYKIDNTVDTRNFSLFHASLKQSGRSVEHMTSHEPNGHWTKFNNWKEQSPLKPQRSKKQKKDNYGSFVFSLALEPNTKWKTEKEKLQSICFLSRTHWDSSTFVYATMLRLSRVLLPGCIKESVVISGWSWILQLFVFVWMWSVATGVWHD